MPNNLWDYFPLPTVPSTTDHYALIVTIPVPSFIAKLLGKEPEVERETLNLDNQYTFVPPPEPELVTTVKGLIQEGHVSLCSEGVGGTYFIRDSESKDLIAVFKPSDEEQGAANNPKKVVQTPLLPPGGGHIREVAAYELDRNHFAGVPETFSLSGVQSAVFASDNVKSGSVQRYIKNDGDSEEYSPSRYNKEDVHRIGTLDIRIFNMDRNDQNLLVQKQEDGTFRLLPIDHTFSLPPYNALGQGCYFNWHYWPQAKQPFSQETRDYVASIDVERDAHSLRALGLEEESVTTMMTTTMLLKEAVAAEWTLYDIACFLTRSYSSIQSPSRFEEFIMTCRQVADERGLSFLEVYRECLPDIVSSAKEASFSA
jgi:hypothetical protein